MAHFWLGVLTTIVAEGVFILLVAILGGNEND
jgi:hypothetical protein